MCLKSQLRNYISGMIHDWNVLFNSIIFISRNNVAIVVSLKPAMSYFGLLISRVNNEGEYRTPHSPIENTLRKVT